jgi:Ni,Fe-hydrogenase III small subunit
MSNWVKHSLLRGIRTTRWPNSPETSPGVTPGRPSRVGVDEAIIANCPTRALTREASTGVDFTRCIHCQRCRHGDHAIDWTDDFTWATDADNAQPALPRRFQRSLHVLYIDAGACGACMAEVRLIDAPPYNLHRFGIFITPTPRDADVLLVAGPVTEAMREPLRKAYDAMPQPRRVVAMGACAIDGGIFGTGFASVGGAAGVIPVDVIVPGCPPPPLAIIHALLHVTGRADSADTDIDSRQRISER